MIITVKNADVEKCLYAAGGSLQWYSSFENSLAFPQKAKQSYHMI